MKGTDALLQSMIAKGITTTFGYPGGTVIPLFDTYLDYQDQIKNILVRHEQGAAHAAEGYAKASGNIGVCIATSGPGATNLVTGIMDAYMDNIPIIAMGGQVPTNLIGNDAFQESDMLGITNPITKHNFQVRSANQMSEVFAKAYKIATEGRPGPVYIDIPKDTQIGDVTKDITKNASIESFKPTFKGNPIQIKKAAQKMLKAEQPLFIAGGGICYANAASEFNALVQHTNIPVVTTMHGKGIIDENHPLALGMLGMHGRKIANYAVVNADLVIAIGCRFSDRITGNLSSFCENAEVIHIDIDPAEIGKNVPVDIPIVGDAKSILKDLLIALEHYKNKSIEWHKKVQTLRQECNCNQDITTNPIVPKKIIYELNKILCPEDIITTGTGQHQMFAMHFLRMTKPRKFISSGGAGTMGFGFPAAIGAKVAKPNSHVFDIDGDGSFQMTMQELGTCKQEGIKIIPIIFRNNYLGMVRQWLELFLDKRYSQVGLAPEPDFIKIAEAYGLTGTKVKKAAEIADALQIGKKEDQTHIIEIDILEESNILPMTNPGGHLKEAFGGCMVDRGKFFHGD